MKRLAVLAVAGLVSVTASAVNWVVADLNQNTIMYVDTDSISRSGQYKAAFLMFTSNPPMYLQNGVAFDTASSYVFIDCKNKPLRQRMESAIFRKNRNVVFSQDDMVRRGAPWQILHPGTLGYSAATLVCSHK